MTKSSPGFPKFALEDRPGPNEPGLGLGLRLQLALGAFVKRDH